MPSPSGSRSRINQRACASSAARSAAVAPPAYSHATGSSGVWIDSVAVSPR
nr:hypothetical protein [Solirubrobacter pauli]